MTLLPINLPTGFIPKVSVGEKVTEGKSIAQNSTKTQESVIHLTKDFGITIKDFKNSLRKNLGDGIKEGDAIAEKKKLLGKTKILSKISGTIARIDEDNGDIYIKSLDLGKLDSIVSPVEGVVDFCDNKKIVIKSQKLAFVAKDAIGVDSSGELFIEDDFTKITDSVNGKIICAKSVSKEYIFKSLSLLASGIITQNLEDLDFLDLSGKEIGGAIILADEDSYKKIIKFEGKKVFLNVSNKSIIIL